MVVDVVEDECIYWNILYEVVISELIVAIYIFEKKCVCLCLYERVWERNAIMNEQVFWNYLLVVSIKFKGIFKNFIWGYLNIT